MSTVNTAMKHPVMAAAIDQAFGMMYYGDKRCDHPEVLTAQLRELAKESAAIADRQPVGQLKMSGGGPNWGDWSYDALKSVLDNGMFVTRKEADKKILADFSGTEEADVIYATIHVVKTAAALNWALRAEYDTDGL